MEPFLHTGEGPRVLLLHSGFCTWVEWRRTAALLEDRREVLAPTLAGSRGGAPLDVRGRTMLQALADDAERILDEAGWDGPVPVVGSSFGGIVALELANRGRDTNVLALAPPWVGPGIALAYYLGLFSPVLGFRAIEWMYPYTSRSRRFTSLFFHQSLTPMELDPEDARELWISAGRFPPHRGRSSQWRARPGTARPGGGVRAGDVRVGHARPLRTRLDAAPMGSRPAPGRGRNAGGLPPVSRTCATRT
jgi:pimeloyl-ACP methyl ester carboxylesterase